MTDSQAIAAARRGERVAGKHSLHAQAQPLLCPGSNHDWRTLFCDGETDVVECSRCGQQGLTECNFNEDYA